MSDWLKDSSIDKLRQLAAYHGDASDIGRAAKGELQQREAEDAKKEAEHSAQVEAQRHQETIALKKESATKEERRFQIQLDETRRQNWWTRVVAIAALVVSVLGFLAGIWMHFHPIAHAPSATSTPSTSSQPPIQTTPKP